MGVLWKKNYPLVRGFYLQVWSLSILTGTRTLMIIVDVPVSWSLPVTNREASADGVRSCMNP